MTSPPRQLNKEIVVDFHTHYLAREHFRMSERTPGGHPVGSSLVHTDNEASLQANGVLIGSTLNPELYYNLDLRMSTMAAMSVAMQLLSPPAYMLFDELPVEVAAKLLREQNEAIAAVVRSHPQSFRGLGAIPFQDKGMALAEINYLMDVLGLEGIIINTQVGPKHLDHPDFEPIWQALDQRQAVIFIHPNMIPRRDLLKRYYLDSLVEEPVAIAIALAHLMFGGVLERYAAIRFVAAYGGGVVPMLLGRWSLGALVRPELAHLTHSPRDLFRRVYVDSLVHGSAELRYLIDMIGANRIVLGTDFPFDMGVQKPNELFGADITNTMRRQILMRNRHELVR